MGKLFHSRDSHNQDVSRRRFLAGAGALTLSAVAHPGFGVEFGAMPMLAPENPKRDGSNLDRLVPEILPYLDLKNTNTGEIFQGYYFRDGAYDMDQVIALNWFMRDWRRSEAVLMDVRLFWAFSAMRQAAMKEGHDGRINFNSGFRTKATNSALEGAARNSMHLKGQAGDFTVPGIKTELVYRYAQWLDVGGVGHYPGRFVHIDTGRERSWVGSVLHNRMTQSRERISVG